MTERRKCGFFKCTGCPGCDPDGTPEAETELQRAQRLKREEAALRAAGKPTLHVKLGDKLRKIFVPPPK